MGLTTAGRKRTSPEPQHYGAHPFQLPVKELAAQLQCDLEYGLSSAKVQEHRLRYGENRLSDDGEVKWWQVLLMQVGNALTLVLVLAMVLAYSVKDYIEGGVITTVIVLNVLIGFVQEFQAEKKLENLRLLTAPTAKVLRNGVVDIIQAAQVVPGDIIFLRAGETVPADIRLIDATNMECDEKNLTGEAVPVPKDADAEFSSVDLRDVSIGERINLAYSTTMVTKGHGSGIAVLTGMSTEIGKIAQSMQKAGRRDRQPTQQIGEDEVQPVRTLFKRAWYAIRACLGFTRGTPLQIQMSKLAYLLFGCAVVLAIIVFAVNRFRVTNEVALYAISTGIAIIPESLIAVLTITFVTAMTHMRRRKVLTRRLNALEALGGITDICTDKTGTVTQGIMVTRRIWLPGFGDLEFNETENRNLDLEKSSPSLNEDPIGRLTPAPSGFEKELQKRETSSQTTVLSDPQRSVTIGLLEPLLRSIALCGVALVQARAAEANTKAAGDPTEIALHSFAESLGRGRTFYHDKGWKKLNEYSFDSLAKKMSVVYRSPDGDSLFAFTKGASERILDSCTRIAIGDENAALSVTRRKDLHEKVTSLAEKGLRVLGVSEKCLLGDFDITAARADVETNQTLLGLIGIYDPPRPESERAIKECSQAGIRVHMLTGDHDGTARAIAQEVGIIPKDCKALSKEAAQCISMTSTRFDSMTNDEIDQLPDLPKVISRCAPSTKTRMVNALHRRGCYVAMTGDGVNDAPSLQAADVGIAMGLGGSDVAKRASAIVLTDDNFRSVVNAIEEGRALFDNIQKFVLHLLCTNFGEIIILIVGLAFQDSAGFSVFPLSPLAILWINMVTSGFPAMGLGREKAAHDIMNRSPHSLKAGIFTWQIIADISVYGALMGTLAISTFVLVIYGPGQGNLGADCNRGWSKECTTVFRARAAVFVELTWLILLAAWEIKSLRRSLFSLYPTTAEDERSRGSFIRFLSDLHENRFLFWAVVIGALLVFPCVYVPTLNTKVFKHEAISWEWAIVVVAALLFVTGIECWKLIKRTFHLLEG